MSPAIKMVTGAVLIMLSMILATSFKPWPMIVGAVLLATVVLGCYLRAPVAYDLTGDQLTVRFRLGEKVFAPVTQCSLQGRVSHGPAFFVAIRKENLVDTLPK
jgi:hypothetical protein